MSIGDCRARSINLSQIRVPFGVSHLMIFPLCAYFIHRGKKCYSVLMSS